MTDRQLLVIVALCALFGTIVGFLLLVRDRAAVTRHQEAARAQIALEGTLADLERRLRSMESTSLVPNREGSIPLTALTERVARLEARREEPEGLSSLRTALATLLRRVEQLSGELDRLRRAGADSEAANSAAVPLPVPGEKR